MECVAWRLRMARQWLFNVFNGCSTSSPRSSAVWQWITRTGSKKWKSSGSQNIGWPKHTSRRVKKLLAPRRSEPELYCRFSTLARVCLLCAGPDLLFRAFVCCVAKNQWPRILDQVICQLHLSMWRPFSSMPSSRLLGINCHYRLGINCHYRLFGYKLPLPFVVCSSHNL